MSLAALLAFGLALGVAAGSPGPSIAALVARVLTNGLRDVLPFLAAMWIGEGIWLTLAVTGLAIVAQSFAAVFVIVKIFGVAYLLFLARKMWLAPPDPGQDRLPDGRHPWRMFVAGMAVTLGNPKIALFYLALVPTLIDLPSVGLVAWLQLLATMACVLIAVDLGWALVAVRARRFLTDRRAMLVANRSSAAVMAGAAVAIAVK